MTGKRRNPDAIVPVRIPADLLAKLDKLAIDKDRSRNYTVRELIAWGLEDCEHGFVRVSCTKCNKKGGRLQ